jgi:hypothetical protein
MTISELPQEIKELAFLRRQEGRLDKFTDDIDDAFEWCETIEGHYYWEKWHYEQVIEVKPKNYDNVIAIIETKIATMSARGFESYYLPVGILKDLIREIKEIK